MAITQTQLDALDEAIASGTLEVWYDHKKVEYRSLDEMMQIRRWMQAEIARAGGPRNRRRVARYHNGL
jgi:hypothetical protein